VLNDAYFSGRRNVSAVRLALLRQSPNHDWHVLLQRPNQRNHPANRRPSKEEIQDQDRTRIPLAAREGKDGRQKIQNKSEAEDRWKKSAKRCIVSS